MSHIPGTEAKDFSAELKTLAANIAFNELAQMRATSKTGGALGAISDREGQLLQSALGALDQDQSPGNVTRQLAQIKDSIQKWQMAKGVGGVSPAVGHTQTPAPSAGPTPTTPQGKRFSILKVEG